jgi:hypothetical protein
LRTQPTRFTVLELHSTPTARFILQYIALSLGTQFDLALSVLLPQNIPSALLNSRPSAKSICNSGYSFLYYFTPLANHYSAFFHESASYAIHGRDPHQTSFK